LKAKDDPLFAGPVWSTFNRRIRRNRIWTRIALRSERSEVDRNWSLISCDDDIRNAIGRAVPNSAKVGMKIGVEANPGDQVVGVWINRTHRDVLVPRIVERKNLFAVETRARTKVRSCLRRRRIIGWTIADVPYADAYTITRHPAQTDSDEHIANVTHRVVQTHDHRRYSREIRNTSDVLDC
jgi:hypothetical protein